MSFFNKINKHLHYSNYANGFFIAIIAYQQYYIQQYKELKSQTRQIELLEKQKEMQLKLWDADVNDLTKKLVQCEYKSNQNQNKN